MAQVLGQVEENTTARMEPLSQSGSDEWLQHILFSPEPPPESTFLGSSR